MTGLVPYKNYTILPAPEHLTESGMWKLNLFILWSSENEEHSRHFATADEYATENEARAHCITFGQQIIDGKIPGSSVG